MKVDQGSGGGGGPFIEAPTGTHLAICHKILDLGTQKNEWQGEVKFQRQILVGWELPLAIIPEGEHAGKPYGVSKFYTKSLGEKANLRKDLINWRGRDFTPAELNGFELDKLLGKACMLSIVKKPTGNGVKVGAIMKVPQGMTVPKQVNPNILLSLEHDEFDRTVFESLSNRMQVRIMATPEWERLEKGTSTPQVEQTGSLGLDNEEDEIPF